MIWMATKTVTKVKRKLAGIMAIATTLALIETGRRKISGELASRDRGRRRQVNVQEILNDGKEVDNQAKFSDCDSINF